MKNTAKGLLFTPYAALVKKLSRNHSSPAKLKLYKKFVTLGKPGCTKPDFLSLERYRGPFTAKQARALFDRFAFGASPEQITAAVNAGLEATVNSFTTWKSEPGFDAVELELRCDGYLANDTRNQTNDVNECPPGNDNAVRDSGVRFDWYNRIWKSSNSFFYKLQFFLHDERMAAGTTALEWCSQFALVDHYHMLRNAASSGNYRQFMHEWNRDNMGHFFWLSGASNSGVSPNENYAREFWELGTVGPTGLDGSPVYSDLDIAQSALAFSGVVEVYETVKDANNKDYTKCHGVYDSDVRHAQGQKTVFNTPFNGTSYAKTVDDRDGVEAATFAHPRTAEHLAEDIWKEFINPDATPTAIKGLAKLIRDNDYNLVPVLKRVMMSKALFAQRTEKTLIKHPLELVFGFLRQTGIPVPDSTYVDSNDNNKTKTSQNSFELIENNMLDDVGEVPLKPPTVFGWNEHKLSGELYVLPWRNSLSWLLNRDPDDLADVGYSYRTRFLSGLPVAGLASAALVDELADYLNVHLNDKQKAELVTYLDYSYVHCSTNDKKDPTKGCDGNGNRLSRDVFDPNPASDQHFVSRLTGALQIIASLPDYRMK